MKVIRHPTPSSCELTLVAQTSVEKRRNNRGRDHSSGSTSHPTDTNSIITLSENEKAIARNVGKGAAMLGGALAGAAKGAVKGAMKQGAPPQPTKTCHPTTPTTLRTTQ